MIRNPNAQVIDEPVLLDAALAQIGARLTAGLSWLTAAYGEGQKLMRLKDGKAVAYPAVYTERKEYLKLFPDSHLGNFCWFDVDDDVAVLVTGRRVSKIMATVGIIFWFDFRDVFPGEDEIKTAGHVKNQVLDALLAPGLASTHVEVKSIVDRTENIYKGYTTAEIDNQFLMRPYGAFRIQAKITHQIPCS